MQSPKALEDVAPHVRSNAIPGRRGNIAIRSRRIQTHALRCPPRSTIGSALCGHF
ncbi:hypothetical protein C7S16_4381 [Burkholderia thailandensis]|uniref:Uncharacterized protein n=1 Tax=Burkholderia thailandensis TaxID=57975 RepID=A0AAW9CMB5_BURTH|nr:hypothetical protein [Burkholderia thailandensis]